MKERTQIEHRYGTLHDVQAGAVGSDYELGKIVGEARALAWVLGKEDDTA